MPVCLCCAVSEHGNSAMAHPLSTPKWDDLKRSLATRDMVWSNQNIEGDMNYRDSGITLITL